MSSYSNIVLDNSRYLKVVLKMLVTQVCYCLPTHKNDLFIRSLVDIQFSLSISNKNMYCLRKEISSVIGLIWLWNQSTFNSDFYQGIVWRNNITILDEWRWHHAHWFYSKKIWIRFTIDRISFKIIINF